MANLPYMKFWVDDYLSATRHLTAQQHGAYLLLLMEAWRRPSLTLPDDDTMLARWVGMTIEEWERQKPVVMGMWKRDGRRKVWVNSRLLEEGLKAASVSRSQSHKSLSGWEKRKKRHAEISISEKSRHVQEGFKTVSDGLSKGHKSLSDYETNKKDDAGAMPVHMPVHMPFHSLEEEKKEATDVASKEKPKTVRGSRLPDGWTPSIDLVDFGLSQGLDAEAVDRETDRFSDYWRGKAGAAGVKVDWSATFRNWIRKAADDRRNRAPPSRANGSTHHERLMQAVKDIADEYDTEAETESGSDSGAFHRLAGPGQERH